MSSKRKIPSKVDFKPIQRRRRSLLSKVLSLENCSDYSENITRVELDMQTEEKVAIIDKLKHHFILGSISEVQLAEILNTVFAVTCPKDHYLFHKGEQGYFFFIIHRGRVQVRIDSDIIKELGPLDSFGDFALLYNAPRTASIFCIEDTVLWCIDRVEYKKQVQKLMDKEKIKNAEILSVCPIFKNLSTSQIETLGKELVLEKHFAGTLIIKEGDSCNAFYIINEGRVRIERNGLTIDFLDKGNSFGEGAFEDKEVKRNASIYAEGSVELYSLSRSSLFNVLGGSINLVYSRNTIQRILRSTKVLKNINADTIERMLEISRIEIVEPGRVFVEKDTDCESLLLVLDGTLADQGLDTGLVFGESELFEDRPHWRSDRHLRFSSGGKICRIQFGVFKQTFGNLSTLVMDQSELMAFISRWRDGKDLKVAFPKIHYIKDIGAGGYGKVSLVTVDERTHALKVISKSTLSSLVEVKLVNTEKEILSGIDFPFLTKLNFYSKLPTSILFFIEYVSGMTFENAIIELDLLDQDMTAFFTAVISLILDYLHHHKIIYRDLKPENLILDKDGYLKLIDFGACKMMAAGQNKDAVLLRTYSIIGTPHYMAPELINGSGYGYSVDLWSLGIMMYEMMIGYVPFGNDLLDVFEIYSKIIQEEVVFPEWFDDETSKEVIKGLLMKNPEARTLFYKYKFKSSHFFDNVKWNSILRKETAAPFVPESVSIEEMETAVEVRMEEISKMENQDKLRTFGQLSLEIDSMWQSLF